MNEPYADAMEEMSFLRRGDLWVREVTRWRLKKTIYIADIMARDIRVARLMAEKLVAEAHAELRSEQ